MMSNDPMSGVAELKALPPNPIVIVSNTPCEQFGVPAGFPVGLVCFAPNGRENLVAVAGVLYGKKTGTANSMSGSDDDGTDFKDA